MNLTRPRRYRWAILVAPLLGVALLAPLTARAAATSPADLRAQLAASLRDTHAPGASWGIEVARLADGRAVFATNQHRLFTPASNTKLFTAALALDRLGGDFRFQTSLATTAAPGPDGTVTGDLIVRGEGDPGFRPHPPGSLAQAFEALAATARQAGVRRVTGDLVADVGFFHAAPYGSGWNWDDLQESYGAAVSDLTANDNLVRLSAAPGAKPGDVITARADPDFGLIRILGRITTGAPGSAPSIRYERLPGSDAVGISGSLPAGAKPWEESLAVPEPARLFGALLLDALRRNGVRVDGQVRLTPARGSLNESRSGTFHPLGSVPSAPVSELVRDCLKPSQNLHAQILLLRVGAEIRLHPRPGDPAPGATDEETGIRALGQFLRQLGASADGFAFEEGSGLSRKNLVSPDTTVRLLRFMEHHRWAAAWREAMPVGGRDGTLKDRFREAPTLGNVHAKSGALRHVASLSGRVTSAGGEPLVFAIFVNNYVSADPGASGRAEIDRLVTLLAAYAGRLGD